MVKTIAASEQTYDELVRIKENFDTKNMDDALDRLITNYKKLLKQLSLKRLIAVNGKAGKVTVDELLKDREVYGWPRKFS